MTAAVPHFNPPPIALALLALGAMYYFSKQNTKTTATRQAVTNPTVKKFRQTLFDAIPTSQRRNAGAAAGVYGAAATGSNNNALQTGLSLFQAIANGFKGNVATSGIMGPVSTEWGLPAPVYNPDTAGESEAQAYYAANRDSFDSVTPETFTQEDAFYQPTGGYLDSQ